MDQEALEAWAKRQAGKTSRVAQPTNWREKLCRHTPLGDITVEEPQYRKGSKRICLLRENSHRACLHPLQRTGTDLAPNLLFIATPAQFTIAHLVGLKTCLNGGGFPLGLGQFLL